MKKKIDNFEYSGIEWRPYTYLSLKKEEYDKILETFKSLEDLDDVQKAEDDNLDSQEALTNADR